MYHLLNILIPVYLLLFTEYSRIPSTSYNTAQQIIVGDGPEDMVLDTQEGENRLLISCSNRRDDRPGFGEIVCLNLKTLRPDTLQRINEPGGIKFRPHGIYREGTNLFVISHENEPDDHIVIIYRINGIQLEFQDIVRSPLLNSPNALVTGPSGELYVVNDSGKRGSLAEKIFRLKRANVIRFEKKSNGDWTGRTVAVDLGYPAGINRLGNRIYVGDAVLHRIHVYRISADGLTPINELKGLKGNDNIRIYQGKLLVPGHIKPFKFVGHAKNRQKKSPVEVYLVDPESGRFKVLFSDDGNLISGGSTAIISEENLYLCQVFEPYILKVDLRSVSQNPNP